MTVEKYLALWLSEFVQASVRPNTYRSYEQLVRNHIIPALGDQLLHDLTALDVQRFLNETLRRGSSPRTVRYLHSVLHVALRRAKKLGLVERNVSEDVEPPRLQRPDVQPFTPEEARRLLDAIKGHELEPLLLLAISTGLRQGEVLGLTWRDVDLEGARLQIRQTLQRVDNKLVIGEPKTRSSRRNISLPEITRNALIRHRERQTREARERGWTPTDLVFTTRRGTPMDGCRLTKRFKALLETAGLPLLRFHDLRHTCASLLIAAGVHPKAIMELLGHTQITITMDLYGHAFRGVTRASADKMNTFLTSGKLAS